MAVTSRRAQGRPQGGSEEIVRAILDATLVELEARGFADLRVEDVARAAGVNKTSVYRRWPSKGDLVLAALRARGEDEPTFVESGELRRDLVDLLTVKAVRLSTPRGRQVMRARMAFGDEEAAALTRALRERQNAKVHEVLTRAVERGALPPGSDVHFLGELLVAPVVHRILMLDEPVDAAFLARIVDHVLAGIARTGAPVTLGPPAASPAGRPRRTRSKQL